MRYRITELENGHFAVRLYIAGQWEIVQQCEAIGTAHRMGRRILNNDKLWDAAVQKVLHRRKYPVVK